MLEEPIAGMLLAQDAAQGLPHSLANRQAP